MNNMFIQLGMGCGIAIVAILAIVGMLTFIVYMASKSAKQCGQAESVIFNSNLLSNTDSDIEEAIPYLRLRNSIGEK